MENLIKLDDLGYHYFWKHPYMSYCCEFGDVIHSMVDNFSTTSVDLQLFVDPLRQHAEARSGDPQPCTGRAASVLIHQIVMSS